MAQSRESLKGNNSDNYFKKFSFVDQKIKNYIYLDTNFIFVPVQLNIDVYQQLEDMVPGNFRYIILTPIFSEIQNKIDINKDKTKFAKEAKLALKILKNIPKNKKIVIDIEKKSNELVDNLILNHAQALRRYLKKSSENKIINIPKIYIATNDREMRKKCRERKIFSIFIRKKQRLAVDIPE